MHDAVKKIIFHAKEKFILLDKNGMVVIFIIFIVITITVTIVNHWVLARCQALNLHALHYLMVWNKIISQKLSSQVQYWGVYVERPGHRTHTCAQHKLCFLSWGQLEPFFPCKHAGTWVCPSWASRTTTFKTWCWCSTKATDDVVVVNNLFMVSSRYQWLYH